MHTTKNTIAATSPQRSAGEFEAVTLARNDPAYWISLFTAVVLLITTGGCQLADMAKFSYANANAALHWASEHHTTTVPFTLSDNHIIVPVSVNGSKPLNFVLDSGAAAMVMLDSSSTRALRLQMHGELPVSGVGDGPDPIAHIVKDTDLAVGDVSLGGLSVIYLPLDSIPFFNELDDVYFDGVIGAPFFSRFVIEVDYDRRLISFTDPLLAKQRIAKLDDHWQEVPLEIESAVPYMAAQVETAPGQSVAVKLLVDTGFRGALSLTPATHSELSEPDTYFETVSQGLSGDVPSRVTISESLTLADYQFHGLSTSYSIAGGESENGSNGLLGNEILQQFNLVFDYPNERLFLAANRSFNRPIAADRSGLQIRPHPTGGIVRTIAPTSTGQNSGLQVGDIITTFDDTTVTGQSLTQLKRALTSERDSVHLCWLSGAVERCEDLALASRLTLHHSGDSGR